MNSLARLLRFAAVAIALCTAAGSMRAAGPPVNIIFDTDMGGDCDDVGALFMLHGAVERGEATLLATMGCVSSDAIAPAIDAINIWFGRPGIPVGTLKDAGFKEGKSFTSELARHFPHRFPSSKDYPDAVALYRQILAQQPDQSVVIVAVGPLRNLANLLKSGPDAASPLDGRALIAKKVKRLDVMGGKYPPHPSRNEKDAEYNFMADAPSTALVCAEWPTPVLFNGEGGSTNSGRRPTYEMPEHNPLTMAYTAYPAVGYGGDRLSWDPVSVLVAVRGAAPWYKVVSGGSNVADPKTGLNRWQPGAEHGHSYLVLDPKRPKREVEDALEDLMVAGKGRPTHLKFNTAYYGIKGGTCRFTSQGERDASHAASKAFDGDEKTAWLDRAAASWIQCEYGDGRKYRVTSYAVVATDAQRRPQALELSGSNDGQQWTVLDRQAAPYFTATTARREFAIARPAKWTAYRLRVTAANASEGTALSTVELLEDIHCQSNVAIAGVTLDHKSPTVPVHQRATLNAIITPLDTWEREVAWASSDPSVAEVRRIGEQAAVIVGRKPGLATITARIDGVTATSAVKVIPSTLPAEWSYHELNAPPIPGSIAVKDGKFFLSGSGHAMTGFWERMKDQGVFVSQPATGNVEISARLTRLTPNVGGPAYAWDYRPPTVSGLMLRESLTEPLSRYLLVQVEASGKLFARWRNKIGPDDNQKKELGSVTLPVHLKLRRTGDEIQVLTSADGRNWGESRFTHTHRFGASSQVGLFVCSGNTFASTTAVFDAVHVSK